MDFHLFEAEFLRLYHAENYADAMNWLRLGGGQFPEKAATLYFWRACITTLLGQPDQAVAVLKEGFDLGYWWAERLLKGDSDLGSLQELPDFIELVARCEARHLEAEKGHPAEVLVYLPDPGFQPPYPLLLVLHGRSSTPEAITQPLLPVTGMGWMLAAVQSSQMLLPGAYAWDDYHCSRDDVRSMMDVVKVRFPVDNGRIVLAGFSQGGGLALKLALSGVLKPRGVIAFAPYLRLTENASESANKNFKVWMATGMLDSRQTIFSNIENLLQTHSISYRREHVENLGHNLPENLTNHFIKAYNFIFNNH